MTAEAIAEKQQAGKLDGWYIVEIFGHQRYAGYVTVEPFGSAVMIRLDVPELKERERVTKRQEYLTFRDGSNGSMSRTVPAGTTVKECSVQGYSKLFGVSAIYAMTPCTEEFCLKAAVEEIQHRPLALVSLPPDYKALPEPEDYDGLDDEAEDDGDDA